MKIDIDYIARIVYDYAIKNREFDEDFVYEIIYSVVKMNNLRDYARYLDFSLDDDSLLCAYDVEKKIVLVDIARLKNNIKNRLNEEALLGINNSYYEFLIKLNNAAVNALVHELSHAAQYKKCLSKDNDIEAKILRISHDGTLKILKYIGTDKTPNTNEFLYSYTLSKMLEDTIYYTALPTERMAVINGLKCELDVIKNTSVDDSLLLYSTLRYKKGMLLGYENGNSPTAFIVKTHNKAKKLYKLGNETDNLKKIEKKLTKYAKKECFTMDDKLYYGFPITDREYNHLANESNKLYRMLIK